MSTQTKYEGIPSDLTIEKAREWVRPRVSEKRFKHVAGVAEVAVTLAIESGCDRLLAELAGWLHDACKETKDKNLIVQAKSFGMALSALEEANGHLLHGPVGAETVKRALGLTNELLLDAIREHTLGAVKMSTLSKVVFLADCLEEGRAKDYTDPIWKALREGFDAGSGSQKVEHKSTLDLDAAILKACDLGLLHIIEAGKVIHPKTIEVRNYYLTMVRSRQL